jgi:hypothetical protein
MSKMVRLAISNNFQRLVSYFGRHKLNYFCVLVLVILTATTFSSYFLGFASPPWDFWGGFLTTANTWWSLGSFFAPPEYLPYLFGGFPAALGLQVGAWYLPVGILHSSVGFSPFTAAVLQACTIGFASIGAYVLARRLEIRHIPALLTATGYFFSPGFFSNAQHTDMLIAWAMFPWLLVTLIPPKKYSALAIVGSSLLWFQFFIAAYPGNIISFAYFFAAIVTFHFFTTRINRLLYLAWIASIVCSGLMMSCLRWAPYFALNDADNARGNAQVMSAGILSTLVFPFTDDALPNDLTMRALFVPTTILLSIFFIRRSRTMAYCFILIVVGVVLGFNYPIFTKIQDVLPMLDVSRFLTNDFKTGLILGLCLLGGYGCEQMMTLALRNGTKHFLIRLLPAILGFLSLLYLANYASLSRRTTAAGVRWFLFSLFSIAIVFFILRLARNRQNPRSPKFLLIVNFSASLILIGATSIVGYLWAIHNEITWKHPRERIEVRYYGSTVATLIENQLPIELAERPARQGPEFPTDPAILQSPAWNGNEFQRSFSTGGYVNLKGQSRFDQMILWSSQPEGKNWFTVLSMESIAWILPPSATSDVKSADCVIEKSCLRDGLKITSWKPGEIEVIVPTGNFGIVTINELAYKGWRVERCDKVGCSSQDVAADESNTFLSAPIDSNVTSLRFYYVTSARGVSWLLFAIGVLIAMGGCLVIPRRSKQSSSNHETHLNCHPNI